MVSAQLMIVQLYVVVEEYLGLENENVIVTRIL